MLNGAPRSGKSTIVSEFQAGGDGVWMNLGVDVFARSVTPERYQPGIGLRPGGERPDLEGVVAQMYSALYDSVAAHSRHGLNVIVDADHHDAYSRPLDTLRDAARRLHGLPALLIGVRCPIEVVMERRGLAGETAPEPVRRWQREVHRPGIYDLEVDTSCLTPAECAAEIRARMAGPPPSAFERLASRGW